MKKPLLIVIAVVLLLLNFIDKDINATAWSTPPYDHQEKFDPALSNLNTVDKLDNYLNSVTEAKGLVPGTVEYVEAIKNVVSERFYHGFSHLSLGQNWVAALAEKVVGYGLSCNVTADEILKHPYAACSQQCIVMMEMLRRRNIDYRPVGFPHHYALETNVKGDWYYFDPNMEPNIPNSERLESKWKDSADNLKKYYDNRRFTDLDWKFGKNLAVTIGTVNDRPARNAARFQNATMIFSRLAWCLPLLVLAWGYRRSAVKKKSPVKQTTFIQSLWLILKAKPKLKLN